MIDFKGQLNQYIEECGLKPPNDYIFDGHIHRFAGQNDREKASWYVIHDDPEHPAGAFGCWRTGVSHKWHGKTDKILSPEEMLLINIRIENAIKTREIERKRRIELAEDKVLDIWTNAKEVIEHPYLLKKGIRPHNARIYEDKLIFPMYSEAGHLSSLQYIHQDGEKRFHFGAEAKSKFSYIDGNDDVVYLAEGFATSATIAEQTSNICYISYSASNLSNILHILRKFYGETKNIVIVADNDKNGVGKKFAEEAALKHGARVVIIPILGDANDYYLAGNDLKGLLLPKKENWLITADDFANQPAPIAWLIKGWIQEKAAIMIHGQSGCGKTFFVLDLCLSIASGKEWNNNKTKLGNVVYLAGEGHHGLRSRIAAWKQEKDIHSLNMWLSMAGCDLDTSVGYQKASDNIRALNKPVSLIVVDTLHRFLSGDENSAQDAKKMLDSCAALMSEFKCSVIFVHHTGVSEAAQHRARGTSAWRGAMESEMNLIAAEGDKIEVRQMKMKDSEPKEPIYFEHKKVSINRWFDEDGEPVTSLVLNYNTSKPMDVKKEDKNNSIQFYRKLFERCWLEKRTTFGVHPYISKVDLELFLLSDGRTEKKIKGDITNNNGLIMSLINAELISPAYDGWRICNDSWAGIIQIL
jgi:phage/plasmid primase-like uncharacterized protein/energy-coupling factor transporter ATP-binding protein EcfA2